MNRIYLSILLLLFSTTISFAIRIKGVVKDNEGVEVPFAVLLVKETNNGTTANADGLYQLDLPKGDYTIICQYLGYESVSKKISVGNLDITENFLLKRQSLTLKEVVIGSKSEDPAIEIIKKVIAQRSKLSKNLQTLETKVYLKGMMKLNEMPQQVMGFKIPLDTLKKQFGWATDSTQYIYMLEQLTDYYYKAPNKTYNHIVSVKEFGNKNGLGISQMPVIVNIYDNNITILNGISKRGFISPVSSNAFNFYKFKYLGCYMEDGKMVDRIQVTPKRKFEPTFTGIVEVVNDDWVLKYIDLKVTKEAELDMVDALHIRQSYRKINTNWIIQNQVLGIDMYMFGFGITGNFTTDYNKSIVNQPISDSIFNSKILSTYSSNALDNADEIMDSVRAIPLSESETKFDIYMDSTRLSIDTLNIKKNKSFSYKFYQLTNLDNTLLGYNTVEGYYINLLPNFTYKKDENNVLKGILGLRYGFASKQPYFSAALSWQHFTSGFRANNITFSVSGGTYIEQVDNNQPISPLVNEIYSLFFNHNYAKFYESKKIRLDINKNWGNGFIINGFLKYENRNSLDNNTNYSFNKIYNEDFTPNNMFGLSESNLLLLGFDAKYTPGVKYIQYPKEKIIATYKDYYFTASYQRAIALEDDWANFDKWKIGFNHNFTMKLAGAVKYNIQVGGFLNTKNVGFYDLNHPLGNQTIFANSYQSGLQLAPYYSFSNSANLFGHAKAEWFLNGLITNKIPGLKQLKWNLVFGGTAYYINEEMNYFDASVGFNNIGFKIFRSVRVDYFVGIMNNVSDHNKVRNGLRLSIKLN